MSAIEMSAVDPALAKPGILTNCLLSCCVHHVDGWNAGYNHN